MSAVVNSNFFEVSQSGLMMKNVQFFSSDGFNSHRAQMFGAFHAHC